MSTGASSTDALQALAVERARAEAAEWSGVLAHHDREVARIEASGASPLRQLVERSAIALDIGQAVGLSEGQVVARISAAQRLRDDAPAVWAAFAAGLVDAHRVREVAATLGRLERSESRERLDERVVAYAASHTVAELRTWLRRAAVRSGSEDDRSRDERRADVFVDLLLAPESESGPRGGIGTDLAVVVDAGVLVGDRPSPATSADGSWTVPAEWVLEHLDAEQTVFHRLLVDPITRDVLAVEHVGRFAPAQLATAIAFRDRVCQAPGCRRPARECDLDHREPWPAGPTAGDNVWALCRRHHSMKGHRVLQWVLPSGRVVEA